MLVAPFPTEAEAPSDWEHWQFSRPIQTASANESRLIRVALPLEVFAHAQESLADLRIRNETGTEVPYVLHAQPGERKHEWRGTQLTETGFVPGQYTQFVADAGHGDALHNALELQSDQKDFFAWVEVAASENRKTWRIMRDRAPIYRFEKDRLTGNQVVSYPITRARWLRLRVLNGEKQFSVTGCRVGQEVIEKAERTPLPMTPVMEPQSPLGESRWRIDVAQTTVPISAVRFMASQKEFHRPVRIATSVDDKAWRDVGHGETYRYRPVGTDHPSASQQRENMQVEFSEARGRYWRISIFNRNDAPVTGLRLELMTIPRHVVFRQELGHTYRLLYGNSRIPAPQYDLARRTPRNELTTASVVTLGKEEVNPGYTSPEPWSERHPVILWGALSLAILVLAGLALRSLK